MAPSCRVVSGVVAAGAAAFVAAVVLRSGDALPSWPIFLGSVIGSSVLHAGGRALTSPSMRVLTDVWGFVHTQLLYVACKLQVADALAAHGGMTAEALAAAVGADATQLRRVLHPLMGLGYFELRADGKWYNTPPSTLLADGAPGTLAPLVQHLVEDGWVAWGSLLAAVRDPAFAPMTAAVGTDFWAHVEAHPAQRRQFARAMTAADSLSGAAVAADYDWNAASRVLDCGGSLGSLLARILRAHPHPVGVLFDLPSVADEARAVWAAPAYDDLRSRVTIVGGSLFDAATVPPARDGDVYAMRLILHDWSDDESIAILKALRSTIGTAAAKVVVVEMAVEEPHDSINAKYLLDLNMRMLVNGKERSRSQWAALFAAAGFRLAAVVPTRSLQSVMEAVPV